MFAHNSLQINKNAHVLKCYQTCYSVLFALKMFSFADYCPYEMAHSFLWNRTQEGKEILKQCSMVDPSWTG